MKVAIFEVCRSPEIKKKTESLILSHFFTKQAIDYKLYSNDGIWQEKTIIDKDSFRLYLKKQDLRSYTIISCHAFKLGISSEQDARTTRISSLLTLRFKCRTAYTVKGALRFANAPYN